MFKKREKKEKFLGKREFSLFFFTRSLSFSFSLPPPFLSLFCSLNVRKKYARNKKNENFSPASLFLYSDLLVFRTMRSAINSFTISVPRILNHDQLFFAEFSRNICCADVKSRDINLSYVTAR